MARSKSESASSGDVAVASGARFAARGGKTVEVETIDWSTGLPRAIAREVVDPWASCPHRLARALLADGYEACPLGCSRAPRPTAFEIALTWASGAWRMPVAYEAISDATSGR